MALINGDFIEIDDQFVLSLEPIANVVSFNFFQDVETGVTADKYFYKEWRISTDNIIFGNWLPLTDTNLQNYNAQSFQPYYVQIRYTRKGTDASGSIEWNYFYLDVTINENAGKTFYPNIFTTPNLFGHFKTDNIDFIELCSNLTEKIIKYGIVPLDISNDLGERTQDYKDYWKAICCWFALHFILAKQFGNIFGEKYLLIDYLTQRGMFLCNADTLQEIQDVAQNYFRRAGNRGTKNLVEELKDLMCIGRCGELIYAYIPKHYVGWTVDQSSPLYKGLENIGSLNKMPDQDWRKIDSSFGTGSSKYNYWVRGVAPAVIDIPYVTDIYYEIIQAIYFEAPSNKYVGIGELYSGGDVTQSHRVKDNYVTVSPYMTYEVSFIIRQIDLGKKLTFGVLCYDCDYNLLKGSTSQLTFVDKIGTLKTTPFFFDKSDIINSNEYFVKVTGYVHAIRSNPQTFVNSLGVQRYLNIGRKGINLMFNNENVRYMSPQIIIHGDNSGSTEAIIGGIRVALSSTDKNYGFVDLSSYALAIGENNNTSYTDEEVLEIYRKYLIPASTTGSIDFIDGQPINNQPSVGLYE